MGTCLCDWSASLEVAKVRSECYAVLWSPLSHLTRITGTFHCSELQHKMVYAFMMSSFSVSQHIWKTLVLELCCSPVSAHAWLCSSAYLNSPICVSIKYIFTEITIGAVWKIPLWPIPKLCLMRRLGSSHITTSQRRTMILMIISPYSFAFVHAVAEGLMWGSTFLPPINPIISLVIVVFPLMRLTFLFCLTWLSPSILVSASGKVQRNFLQWQWHVQGRERS